MADNNKLDAHAQAILEEYRQQRPVFAKMRETIPAQVRALFDEAGIVVTLSGDALHGKMVRERLRRNLAVPEQCEAQCQKKRGVELPAHTIKITTCKYYFPPQK